MTAWTVRHLDCWTIRHLDIWTVRHLDTWNVRMLDILILGYFIVQQSKSTIVQPSEVQKSNSPTVQKSTK